MGDAFRRLFLSIGVALGLVAGQGDPALVARAYREGGAVLVDARIDGAFAPGALDLVESGTRVALRYSVRAEAEGSSGAPLAEASELRSLRYELRLARYEVSFDGGKIASLVDPGAARALAAEARGLELRPAARGAELARVIVRAEIGILDSRGEWHDAPVLWNYSSPRAVLRLDAEGGR